LGLPGPLPGGAYPIIEIGQQNPDCHIPEVSLLVRREIDCRFKRGRRI
jgi:hypothetical protein